MQDINYDKVVKGNSITVTLNGKKYEVQEPTVEQVIALEKEQEVYRESIENMTDGESITSFLPQLKRIIGTIYTTIPDEAWDKVSPKALYKVCDDIRIYVNESMMPDFTREEKPPTGTAKTSKSPKKK